MRFLFLIATTFYVSTAFAIRANNPVLMSAVANSGTKVSSAIDASQIVSGSIQASFTDGAAAGTIAIQCSNDPLPSGPSNWNTPTNGSAAVTSGALTLITLPTIACRWLRASWTSTGGAGTLTVNGFFTAM
jgi:hypothetical protein